MINLYHLRYFVDAARSGSLSVAARKNRVSQSAVSQAIRSLERALDLPLTTHQKKVLNLTEEGRALVASSDEVFHSLEKWKEAIQGAGSGFSGSLSVACTNTIATGLLPSPLGSICSRHPRLKPAIRIGNSETIKDWLLGGEAELGLMVDDGRLTREFKTHTIRKGKYVLFRGKKALKPGGLVVTRREREEVQYFLRHLQRSPLVGDIQCEITSWEAIRFFVEQSGVYGICPDYVVERGIAEGRLALAKVPFQNPHYRLVAVHLARRPLGKNARLLLDSLIEGQGR